MKVLDLARSLLKPASEMIVGRQPLASTSAKTFPKAQGETKPAVARSAVAAAPKKVVPKKVAAVDAAVKHMTSLAAQTQGTLLSIEVEDGKATIRQSHPFRAGNVDAVAETSALLSTLGMAADKAEDALHGFVDHLEEVLSTGALVLSAQKGQKGDLSALAEVAGLDRNVCEMLFSADLKKLNVKENVEHLHTKSVKERETLQASGVQTAVKKKSIEQVPVRQNEPAKFAAIFMEQGNKPGNFSIHLALSAMESVPTLGKDKLKAAFDSYSEYTHFKRADAQFIRASQSVAGHPPSTTPSIASPDMAMISEASDTPMLKLPLNQEGMALTPSMALGSMAQDRRHEEEMDRAARAELERLRRRAQAKIDRKREDDLQMKPQRM